MKYGVVLCSSVASLIPIPAGGLYDDAMMRGALAGISRVWVCLLFMGLSPLLGGCEIFQLPFVVAVAVDDKIDAIKHDLFYNGDFTVGGTVVDEAGQPMPKIIMAAEVWTYTGTGAYGVGEPMATPRFLYERHEHYGLRLVFYKPGYRTQVLIFMLGKYDPAKGLVYGHLLPRPPYEQTVIEGKDGYKNTDLRIVMKRLGPDEVQSTAPGPGFRTEGPFILPPSEVPRLRPFTRPACTPVPQSQPSPAQDEDAASTRAIVIKPMLRSDT